MLDLLGDLRNLKGAQLCLLALPWHRHDALMEAHQSLLVNK
jgi:hypothetical protein